MSLREEILRSGGADRAEEGPPLGIPFEGVRVVLRPCKVEPGGVEGLLFFSWIIRPARRRACRGGQLEGVAARRRKENHPVSADMSDSGFLHVALQAILDGVDLGEAGQASFEDNISLAVSRPEPVGLEREGYRKGI